MARQIHKTFVDTLCSNDVSAVSSSNSFHPDPKTLIAKMGRIMSIIVFFGGIALAGVNGPVQRANPAEMVYCVTYLSTFLERVSIEMVTLGPKSPASSAFATVLEIVPTSSRGPLVSTQAGISAPGGTSSRNTAPGGIFPGETLPGGTLPVSTTSSSTTSSSAVSLSPTPSPNGAITGQAVIFLVAPSPGDSKRRVRKRALGGFISTEASANPPTCDLGSVFILSEGRIFVRNQPVFYSPGEPFKQFRGSESPPAGAILTTFAAVEGNLQFRNDSLPSGQSRFCQDIITGQVYLTFTSSPLGCLPISIVTYGIEQCQNGRIVSAETSGSSSTSSTQFSLSSSIFTRSARSISSNSNPTRQSPVETPIPTTAADVTTASADVTRTGLLSNSSRVFASTDSSTSTTTAAAFTTTTTTESVTSTLASSSSVASSSVESASSVSSSTVASSSGVGSSSSVESPSSVASASSVESLSSSSASSSSIPSSTLASSSLSISSSFSSQESSPTASMSSTSSAHFSSVGESSTTSASSSSSTVSPFSSTPSIVSSTSASISATSSSAQFSSSSSAASTPTPSAGPSNFCLRVLNSGVDTSGYVLKYAGSNQDYTLRAPTSTGTTAIFSLDAQGRLIVTNSNPDYTNALTVSGTGLNRSFRPQSNPGTSSYVIPVCTVRTDVEGYAGRQVLKCTATIGATTYTGFRSYRTSSGGTPEIIGTSDLTTATSLSYLVELGLFTGTGCTASTLPPLSSNPSSSVD